MFEKALETLKKTKLRTYLFAGAAALVAALEVLGITDLTGYLKALVAVFGG